MDGASPATAANLPTDVPAVDGADPGPTAGFPADGPGVVEHLHGPLQTFQVNLRNLPIPRQDVRGSLRTPCRNTTFGNGTMAE